MKQDFLDLGIKAEMVEVLKENGITDPTPIQTQVIPELLRGKDVIAQAQTGTGKTLAFVLPIFEQIDLTKDDVQALIVTPTRELAIQITAEARKLTAAKAVNLLAAYGGQDVEQQIRRLKGNIHMVICTPGRLLDHLRRQTINIKHLKMLVLDEADQMLHMGFINDVESIIKQTPVDRQTMFFSATMPREIRSLAAQYMNEPVQIQVKGEDITLREIKQLVIETTDRGKQAALIAALEEYRPFMAIIFCRTKRRAKALNEALGRNGYKTDELHGDLTQAKREKVMKAFRSAKLQFLVATDVAARGLDIEGITHVFNYDIPQDTEDYIHRIGRTGRAGQMGMAVTFVSPKDRDTLMLIEKGIRMAIDKRKVKVENPDTQEWILQEGKKKLQSAKATKPKNSNKQEKYRNNRSRPMEKEKGRSTKKSGAKGKSFSKKKR